MPQDRAITVSAPRHSTEIVAATRGRRMPAQVAGSLALAVSA